MGATLGSIIEGRTALESLYISRNRVGDSGASKIADALFTMFASLSLKLIDLSSNSIGCSGATALGDALSMHRSLNEINLAWNRLKAPGANAILKAIVSPEPLRIQSLNLSFNGLCDEPDATGGGPGPELRQGAGAVDRGQYRGRAHRSIQQPAW